MNRAAAYLMTLQFKEVYMHIAILLWQHHFSLCIICLILSASRTVTKPSS
jgi:hypothetical protein